MFARKRLFFVNANIIIITRQINKKLDITTANDSWYWERFNNRRVLNGNIT